MLRPDAPTQGEVGCPDCNDTGIISRPYMIGLRDGDLYTMSKCPCATPQKESHDD